MQVQHTFMMEHGVLIQGSDWTEKAKGPKSCSEFSTPAPRFKKEAGAQQGPYRTGPILEAAVRVSESTIRFYR